MRSTTSSKILDRNAILFLTLAATAAAAACASEFDSCESTMTCRPEPGDEGDSGSAGADASAQGGGGEGGSSAPPQGESGAGGAAPTCDEEGAASCEGEGRLVCVDGVWTTEECEAGFVCAVETAECTPIAAGCEDREALEAYCDENVLRECGPDRTTLTEEACEGTCVNAQCQPPGCGDGAVQEGEACDDGNDERGDGCSVCKWEPIGVKAMAQRTCAWFADGRLKCWGRNHVAQLGLGDTRDRGSLPTDMGANLRAIQIEGVTDVGGTPTSTCAIANGELWCWGENDVGQLAAGNVTPRSRPQKVPFTPPRRFTEVEGANAHSFCAIPEDLTETPLCWGNNDYGQTGAAWQSETRPDVANDVIGDAPNEIARNPGPNLPLTSSITLGDRHGCAVANGVARCWGENSRSLLLANSTIAYYGYYRNDTAIPQQVDLGTFTPRSVAAGQHHTCALSTGGDVKCWGYVGSGVLGTSVSVAADREVAALGVLDLGGRVQAIAAGRTFTCALLVEGGVKCWGSSSRGVLGQPQLSDATGVNIGDSPGELGEALPPIRLGGAARSITAGDRHVCVQLMNSEIKCWGSNEYGQLGLGRPAIGNDLAMGDQVGEMDALRAVDLD